MSTCTNNSKLFLLAVIPLLLFGVLAFKSLPNQGILFHDIGMNLLEAKFVGEGVQLASEILRSPGNIEHLWSNLKAETTGVPPHVGKPVDCVTLWFASLFRGFHDTLSAEVSMICALATLIAVFFITLRSGNTREAVYAVACLASSLLYFTINRSAFADSISLIFFMTALWIYPLQEPQDKKIRRFFMVGVFLGLTFACTQWRAAFILGIIFMLEFLRSIPSLRKCFLRLIAISSGFAIPILFFQLPYILLEFRLGPLPFPSYWEQLAERLTHGRGLNWFQDPSQLFKTYWFLEQGVFPSLVILGWLILIIPWLKKRSFSDLFFLGFTVLPYAYFSVMLYHNMFLPRATSLVLPIAAICAGIGLSRLQGFAEYRWPVFTRYSLLISFLVVISLGVQGTWRQWHYGITRSGYSEASLYLKKIGATKIFILSMEPIWRFYLGRVAYNPYSRPKNLKDLIDTGKSEGIEHLVFDYATLNSFYGMNYTRKLLDKVVPEKVFDNPRGRSLPYLLDDYGLHTAKKIVSDPAADKIYIYSIRDIAAALADGRLRQEQ